MNYFTSIPLISAYLLVHKYVLCFIDNCKSMLIYCNRHFSSRKQNGERAKLRNLEEKWRKNCCFTKIQKKLNIKLSLNLMIKIKLNFFYFLLYKFYVNLDENDQKNIKFYTLIFSILLVTRIFHVYIFRIKLNCASLVKNISDFKSLMYQTKLAKSN